MPELPEVEHTRRNLVRAGLPGCTITNAEITWANTVKRPSAAELAEGLKGRTVQNVQRRGKYLIFPLSGGNPATFMVHLGMTGRLHVHPQSQDERLAGGAVEYPYVLCIASTSALLVRGDRRGGFRVSG